MQAYVIGILTAVLLCAGPAVHAQPSPPSGSELDSLIQSSIRIELDMDTGGAHTILKQIPPEVWAKLDTQEVRRLVMQAFTNYAAREPAIPAMPEPPVVQWEQDVLIPLVGIFVPFASIVLVVLIVLSFRNRSRHQAHEERMALIEKGIADPSMFTDKPKPKVPSSQRMMVWGLFLALGGVGLALWNILDSGIADAGFGLFVSMIGAALLIASKYVGKPEDTEDQLPG